MGWAHSVKLLLEPGRAERKDFKKVALIVVTLSLHEDVLTPALVSLMWPSACPGLRLPLTALQAESRPRHEFQGQK